MQTTGQINDISIDFKTNKPKITILLDSNEISNIEELNGSKLNIELKKWYPKRSLDINAYCWVLCDKIAKKLSEEGTPITKNQVYKDCILQMGSFQPMIVEEKAFENFERIWKKQGLGYLVQEVSKKDKCIKVNCYYGSSSYDNKEMTLLVNFIVDMAKQLNIETRPENELQSLLKEWK